MSWSPHRLVYRESIPVAVKCEQCLSSTLPGSLLARQGKALWAAPGQRAANSKVPWAGLEEQ